MSAERDWERSLRETSYDLSEEKWQKLENDMRAWLVQEARRPAQAPPLLDRAKSWLRRWGLVVVGGAAIASVGFGLVMPGVSRTAPATFAWRPGQVLDAKGRSQWDWREARTRMEGENARMVLSEVAGGKIAIRLERGSATFHVQHRQPEESFRVDVGDCQVHVVGTVFTVGIDSLDSWVQVEEGRIRMEGAGRSRFVDAGSTTKCKDIGGSAASRIDTASPPRRERTATVAASGVSIAKSPAPIEVPRCSGGPGCVEQLSAFVRNHPEHAASAEVALRWARISARTGDARDALVAFSIAAGSPTFAGVARMESLRLRMERLSQDRMVADSLDAWIPALPTGSALWQAAWRLRAEVARRQGDEALERRASRELSGTASAQGGP